MNFWESYTSAVSDLYPAPESEPHLYTNEVISAAEVRLGVTLPGLLKEFYRRVGDREIHGVNQFLPPEGLRVRGGHIVMMEECRLACVWGLPIVPPGEDDPPAFQCDDESSPTWVKIADHLSEFLMGMLFWNAANGGLPQTAGPESVPAQVVERIRDRWPLRFEGMKFSAYGEKGVVICIDQSDVGWNLNMGLADGADVAEVERITGVKVDG